MQELCQLAFQETDPRVKAVASWALAAACHAQKHQKLARGDPPGGPGRSPEGYAEGSKLAAQLKNMTGLPPDGAMKALVEIVVQGQLLGSSLTILCDICLHCKHLQELTSISAALALLFVVSTHVS